MFSVKLVLVFLGTNSLLVNGQSAMTVSACYSDTHR